MRSLLNARHRSALRLPRSLPEHAVGALRAPPRPPASSPPSIQLRPPPPTPNHSKAVCCPLCGETEEDKESLVSHLDICRGPLDTPRPFSACEILPEHLFKCLLCTKIFLDFDGWAQHMRSRKHIRRRMKEVGNKPVRESLTCSSCRTQIPSTFVQVQFHLSHEIHMVRRDAALGFHYLRNRDIQSMYQYSPNGGKIRCLICPHVGGLEPPEFLRHLQTPRHIRNRGQTIKESVYCCFCREDVLCVESLYHFESLGHFENETRLSAKDGYQLCIYCGFSCDTVPELSEHMEGGCGELSGLRERMGKTSPREGIDAGRCILIKKSADTPEVLHMLKRFGEIQAVEGYDEESLVVEFTSRIAVVNVMMVRSYIKVRGEKVNIRFFGEQENPGSD